MIIYHQANKKHQQYSSSTTRGTKEFQVKGRVELVSYFRLIEASQMISRFSFELFTLALKVGTIYDNVGQLASK